MKKILHTTLLLAGTWFIARGQLSATADTLSSPGLADRAYWAALLYRIAYPVAEALSNEQLKARMPIEKAPGYGLNAARVTHLEAIGRTVAGVAPWLQLPDDQTEEGIARRKLRLFLLEGLPHIVDPDSPDYLNFETEYQPIVDAAFLAHGFLRAPEALWEPLDSLTKRRFIHAFQSLRTRKAWYSNWLLFSGITEAFLMQAGAGYDPVRMDYAYRKFKEWYVGDGWYQDGEHFAMDYYNSYVIHPMLTDMLRIMVAHRLLPQSEYEQAVRRMVRYAVQQERMISPEGTFPITGRSITYRNAAFQALGQVVLQGKLPEDVAPAQVRGALTEVTHRLFDAPGTFDSAGWLQLGLAGHQPDIADTYTSTGSLYLCTTGFLPLGLPASHPFWTDPPVDWTSKKAWAGKPVKKDYKVDY